MDEKSFDAKRRNLLLVTTLIIFIKYADAQIESAATMSMFKFEIRNPEAIIQTLWLLWAYTFARAYQHYRYHFQTEYRRSIQKTTAPILHPFLAGMSVPDEQESYFFEDIERFHQYELTFCRWDAIAIMEYCLWRTRHTMRAIACMFKTSRHKGRPLKINLLSDFRFHNIIVPGDPYRLMSNPYWKIKVWTITNRSKNGGGKLPVEIIAQMDLGFFQGLRLQLRLLYSLILKSAPFFEYRLPFLYALAPLPYYVFF